MPPTAQPNHDPALTQAASNPPQAQVSQPQPGVATTLPAADMSNVHLPGLDQNQIISLLRHLPNMFGKLAEQNSPKEDAAQALSNLAAHPAFGPPPVHYPPAGLPGINDPGPSSHPRGPPNLGQLSAVALQATPAAAQQSRPENSPTDDRGVQQLQQQQSVQPINSSPSAEKPTSGSTTTSTGGRRGRNPAMGSDEWSRQRKDNHKEVERRRRGNINEGINELGRIVPNGNGEKAKGAILARSVQYIHHLKENEARNIEKWTLEKLLMDQAMGDLQNQLEEVKRLWEEERNARQRLELELETLRNTMANNSGTGTSHQPHNSKSPETLSEPNATGAKRRSDETAAEEGGPDRQGKRPRAD